MFSFRPPWGSGIQPFAFRPTCSLDSFVIFWQCVCARGLSGLVSGTKKQPKEQVLGPDIRRTSTWICRRTSGQKLRSGPQNPGKKNKHIGADVHEPKARTSMTPGRFKKNSGQKNFRLNFRSLLWSAIFAICRHLSALILHLRPAGCDLGTPTPKISGLLRLGVPPWSLFFVKKLPRFRGFFP